MDLYLYSARLDLAATTLADLQLLIAAIADELDPDNSATISRVTAKVQPLVQSDTGEPITLYVYDDASTVASWVSDAATTLRIGLGFATPGTTDTFASTSDTTIVAGPPAHRTALLALNSESLAAALSLTRPQQFFLHLRKTTAGNTETVARIPVEVVPGVLSSSTSTDDENWAAEAATSAALALASQQAAAASEQATASSASAAAASEQAAAASEQAAASSETAAAASATTAAAAQTYVQEHVDNITVLISETAQSATFAFGDNITVADGTGTYASAIITFPV